MSSDLCSNGVAAFKKVIVIESIRVKLRTNKQMKKVAAKGEKTSTSQLFKRDENTLQLPAAQQLTGMASATLENKLGKNELRLPRCIKYICTNCIRTEEKVYCKRGAPFR